MKFTTCSSKWDWSTSEGCILIFVYGSEELHMLSLYWKRQVKFSCDTKQLGQPLNFNIKKEVHNDCLTFSNIHWMPSCMFNRAVNVGYIVCTDQFHWECTNPNKGHQLGLLGWTGAHPELGNVCWTSIFIFCMTFSVGLSDLFLT